MRGVKYIILILLIVGAGIKVSAQTFYSQMAAQYASEGNFEKAIELEKEGLEMWERINGEDNEEYAFSLHAISQYYAENGNFQDAINYLELAIKKMFQLEVKKISVLPLMMSTLATYYTQIGNNEEAIEIYLIVLPIIEKYYSKNHVCYFETINNLSVAYAKEEEFNNAIKYSEDLLQSLKNNYNDHNQSFLLSCLNNLVKFYNQIGKKKKALGYMEQYFEFKFDNYLDVEYGKSLIELAYEYSLVNNYPKSIGLSLKGLEILELKKEQKDPYYSNGLHNLAEYYSHTNQYDKAIEYCNQALEIKKIIGNNSSDYYSTLNNLGRYYAYKGDTDQAISIGEEVINNRDLYDEEAYGLYLDNLVGYYNANGDYEKEDKLWLEAIDIIYRTKGKESIDYAIALEKLSDSLWKNSQYYQAVGALLISQNIYKEKLSNKHPYYFNIYRRLTPYYFSLNDSENLKTVSIGFYSSSKEWLINNFSLSPKEDRNLLWQKYKKWYDIEVPFINYNLKDSQFTILSFNALLLSKGILLNSEMEFDQFIGETGNEDLLEKYNEIKRLRLQLNKLYEKPITERFCDTDSLERHVNELERKLMDESSEYGDYTKNLTVTWEDVQKGLGKKDAAIEFVHFPLNQDSIMYMAYVLRPEVESPSMVKLFEEKDLSKLTGSKLNLDKNNLKGSQLIWGKLQLELEGVENVYFAPDGILHQIPIEYLPDFEDEEKLVSDRYNLHRVSSTRQLAFRKDTKKSDKAVVYGGIQYDTNPELLAEDSHKYENGSDRGFQPWYNLGDTLSMRSGVKYLPFTLTEATSVSAMLEENHQQSILITGDEATEASFKSLSGKKDGILHIATHGFYWQEEEADKMSIENERLMFMSQFGDNARRNVEDKALTRTGLFMAGANNALSGKEIPEDIDDGILTASEIANLDLRGTDLVVLSACQTGMGDIGGDGVFGLQRGFKKAGVNTILMSLWDVDDAATGMFMTEFYRNFTEGKTKQASLKEAQDKVRNFKGEINGEYRNFSNPRYWAAYPS